MSDDLEDLSKYTPGGYHPVHLGDVFCNRYKIKQKLGHGGFSTVWLARDQDENRLVALKIHIATADAEACDPSITDLKEVEAELWLKELDRFTVAGPNGDHLCVVTEVLGPSVLAMINTRIPVSAAKKVVVQLSEAVKALHAHGIVHGDLYFGNVLFKIPGIDTWTDDEIVLHFGEPARELLPDNMSSNRPAYLVFPIQIENIINMCYENPLVRIIDFGQAFKYPPGVTRALGIPNLFAAPEVIFRSEDEILTPAVDIWSLGCLIYNILGDHSLWEAFGGLDDVLMSMTLAYGRLPERYWVKWEHRKRYFKDDGTLNDDRVGKITTEDQDLRGLVMKDLVLGDGPLGFDSEEMDSILNLMEQMMKLEPSERIDANEVVRLLPDSWKDQTRNKVAGANEVVDANEAVDANEGVDTNEVAGANEVVVVDANVGANKVERDVDGLTSGNT